jgi:hypothetical protein
MPTCLRPNTSLQSFASVHPKAWMWPSAVDGAPPLRSEPTRPSATVWLYGVYTLSSYAWGGVPRRAMPATCPAFTWAQSCRVVSFDAGEPSPRSQSTTGAGGAAGGMMALMAW